MFLRPTGYAVASVTDCTCFENERSASALVVTEKCTSLPAVGCQQLVRKISQQQEILNYAENGICL